jgi:hypothetical protein
MFNSMQGFVLLVFSLVVLIPVIRFILIFEIEPLKREVLFNGHPLDKHLSLAAYHYVYKNPVASFQALTYFRKSYSNSPILLIGLNGFNFSLMAKHFNASYVHFDSNIYKKLSEDLGYYSTFLLWIFDHFEKEEFVMYLEDDVRVIHNKSIDNYEGVLNGRCVNKIGPLVRNSFQVWKDNFYTGHGGSVFNRIKFLKLFHNLTRVGIVSLAIEDSTDASGGDFKISTLILALGGQINCLTSHEEYDDGGLFPLNLSQIENVHKSVAVVHQWKRDYDVPIPKDIERLIQRTNSSQGF